MSWKLQEEEIERVASECLGLCLHLRAALPEENLNSFGSSYGCKVILAGPTSARPPIWKTPGFSK